ncbi:MAG: PAS domain S-box protein [Acidobacteriota bacterium]
MRTSEQIQAEIGRRLGFLPPFFAPAVENPLMLENLWQQMRVGYLDNPLPALFKERLCAYLARFSTSPYCLACHSCGLYSMGLNAQALWDLIESRPPSIGQITEQLTTLKDKSGPLTNPSSLNPVVEKQLWLCSIAVHLSWDVNAHCRQELRRLMGTDYLHLIALLSFIKTAHFWTEVHTEIEYLADQRVQKYLPHLIKSEPRWQVLMHGGRELLKPMRGLQEGKQIPESQFQRAEQALRESEACKVAILESALDAIIIANHEGNIIEFNPAAERMFGYLREEVLDKEMSKLIFSPLSRHSQRQGVANYLATGEQLSLGKRFETTARRADGSEFPAELTITPSGLQGMLLFISYVRDITERKRAEEALRKSEAEKHALINSIPDLMFRISRDGILLDYIATRNEQLFLTPAQFLGKKVNDVMPPDFATKCMRLLERALTLKELQIFEYELPINGELRNYEARIVVSGEDEVLAIVRNITERKQAEREQARLQVEIQNAASVWRTTVDAIDSLILTVNAEGCILRMNRAAKELLKNDYKDNIGQLIETLGNEQPWQQAAECIRLTCKTRTRASCQVRDTGNGKTWEILANLMGESSDGDELIIVVARDITQMVELQESLRRNETMSAMGALVAGVAHEVRNPLFGVSATLDAFEARFGMQEEYKRYINVLRGELDRMTELMRELLEYGKPPTLELSPGLLEEVVAQAVNSCTPLAERTGVKIVNNINREFVSFLMDRRRLLQVFQNLLENAIQHSPAGQTVIIDAEEISREGQICIECMVKDSGSGFRAEDLPKIFEPFFTRRRGGTGLGLSIVQRIMDEHGGKVLASNHPEGGAVMTVRFPLRQQ